MNCNRTMAFSTAALVGSLALGGLLSNPCFGQSRLPPASRSEISNPREFAQIPAEPYTCDESITRCGREVLANLGTDGPGTAPKHKTREEVFTFANGVVIFLLTIGGLEDDAVEAERYRVAFRQDEDGIQLVQVGRQQKCARGSQYWTRQLCP